MLIRQPNGKYCEITYSNELKFVNYTEQDIIDLYIKKAKQDMENAECFGKIIECAERRYFGSVTRYISDEQLKDMGFDKPYKELIKFIPCEPLHTSYAPCDFATYGECPNCGATVRDGMGYTDEKCKCGQLLKWKG